MTMGPRGRRRYQRWCAQPLTPLLEGPDPDTQGEAGKKESSWDVIRTWVRMQMEKGSSGGGNFSTSMYGNSTTKWPDLKLMLGVLGCPLAPISLATDAIPNLHVKDIPITSSAHYILQQYLAATGCLKLHKCMKSLYAAGTVKMVCCETEIASGKNVRNVGTRGGENGCFVVWQMSPGMWSVELVVAGSKVVAGSNGKIVWRHIPWLGTHAAKGPQRPLRRIIQGLDPKSTASTFAKAQCLGEKRIGDDDCFVLKVAADRATVVERSDGSAEVIRHVLYGYFNQRTGLLIYMEDSHLTRVQAPGADAVYWETTIGSSIEDYREVDGVLIAHCGRSIATIFRFGEVSMQHTRTRMEEVWRIDDVVFNVPGLSIDYFIPPADIFDTTTHMS
ncbi:uncharacterized protein LOC131221131 isoform X2 [Magnolia sinica]|uniref:uncharacterized protein LOC131221131 isoform X2 n=1 Tax=Magnolia sinica TaxID=86752 RepID=UPI00265B5ECB|nr:uncharacterized protein LOC131221131 isoform X2 [Magnolia sinica]